MSSTALTDVRFTEIDEFRDSHVSLNGPSVDTKRNVAIQSTTSTGTAIIESKSDVTSGAGVIASATGGAGAYVEMKGRIESKSGVYVEAKSQSGSAVAHVDSVKSDGDVTVIAMGNGNVSATSQNVRTSGRVSTMAISGNISPAVLAMLRSRRG